MMICGASFGYADAIYSDDDNDDDDDDEVVRGRMVRSKRGRATLIFFCLSVCLSSYLPIFLPVPVVSAYLRVRLLSSRESNRVKGARLCLLP